MARPKMWTSTFELSPPCSGAEVAHRLLACTYSFQKLALHCGRQEAKCLPAPLPCKLCKCAVKGTGELDSSKVFYWG